VKIYNQVLTGEISGSVTAKQLPDVGGIQMVQFVASTSNAGNVYLGSEGVTKPDGTQDATAGIPIPAGYSTPLYPIQSLSLFWIICDNAGDDLVYMAVG
jgi:hypothetical protein